MTEGKYMALQWSADGQAEEMVHYDLILKS